jgi:ribosome-associated translation inhibitor RaiA
MSVQHKLEQELTHYQYLKDRLIANCPELEDDEQALLDTLEGETSVNELCLKAIRQTEDDQDLIAGIDQRINQLKERKQRLQHRVEATRNAVASVMERAGIQKVQGADYTLSCRAIKPSVRIVNEDDLPEDYWREKVSRSPDKTTIKQALDDGYDVPGAALSNGGTGLTVRAK